MEKSDKILAILADTFDLPIEKVSIDSSPANTPEWDSFAQMSLVLNIETEYSIVLEYEEIFEIVSAQSLIDLVKRKTEN